MIPLPEVAAPTPPHTLRPLEDYDAVIVAFSGGKDSIACVAALLEAGVPAGKLRLWHQHVDGDPAADDTFMDWPVTGAYVRAVGAALGLPVRFQWKHGGFRREMLRDAARTAPTSFELEAGGVGTAGGVSGKYSTRRKFPQVSAYLSVRWCSAYLKIDPAALAINNDPFYARGTFLFVSGERREESAARSKYAASLPHRTTNGGRRVDHWRPVLDWDEAAVWAAMRRLRVVPHPGYRLGFGRLSCMSCIFADPDQWATIRQIDPARLATIHNHETEFGLTIKRGLSVADQADRGAAFPAAADAALVRLALGREYPPDQALVPTEADWVLPAGAFRRSAGPT